MPPDLPPGQVARSDFPRFGLTQYANRFPSRPADRSVLVKGPSQETFTLDDPLAGLPRVAVETDFHCVTTWSKLGLRWSGVRFSDFFGQKIRPLVPATEPVTTVVLRAQDGYRTSLPLVDLLAEDVLIVDELDGQPLSIAHGAPLRIVAPGHYGYKSLKHLSRLEFCSTAPELKRGLYAFLDHPRARVSYEERGLWFPGWLLRRIFRPLIPGTVKTFREALQKYERNSGGSRDG